jgi:hypothetical protein
MYHGQPLIGDSSILILLAKSCQAAK